MKDITAAKPSKELLIKVKGLMRASTGIGTLELPLAKNLRSALGKILGREMKQIVVTGAVSDGVVEKSIQDYSVPLLMMEYKRGVGEGGCDPITQAAYSVLKYWRREPVNAIGF